MDLSAHWLQIVGIWGLLGLLTALLLGNAARAGKDDDD